MIVESRQIEKFKRENCFWCNHFRAWITKRSCMLNRCKTKRENSDISCISNCPQYKRPTKREMIEYSKLVVAGSGMRQIAINKRRKAKMALARYV